MNACVARCSDGSYEVRVPELPQMYFGSLWEAMDFTYGCVKDGQTAGNGVPHQGNTVRFHC